MFNIAYKISKRLKTFWIKRTAIIVKVDKNNKKAGLFQKRMIFRLIEMKKLERLILTRQNKYLFAMEGLRLLTIKKK